MPRIENQADGISYLENKLPMASAVTAGATGDSVRVGARKSINSFLAIFLPYSPQHNPQSIHPFFILTIMNKDQERDGHLNASSQSQHPLRDDHFATRLVHVGSKADPTTKAIITPISLSTTYSQSQAGVHSGFEYARSLNPNRLDLETVIASIEGVNSLHAPSPNSLPLPNALAFSSGSAATATIINGLVGSGGHLIAMSDLYGGTHRYLNQVASNLGISFTMLDLSSKDDSLQSFDQVTQRVKSAIQPNLTKLIWVETPTNPALKLVDIHHLSNLARDHQLILVVDNTFLSSFYQQPILLGADVVIHSATKYLNGHSDVVLGVVISPHQHLIEKLRFLQNAHGAVPSPFDCWLAQRGLKTLELRMLRHGTNALQVASWFQDVAIKSGWINQVTYIGLTGSQIAWRQIPLETREKLINMGYAPTQAGSQAPNRFPYGGMISFRIRKANGDNSVLDTANRFLTNCRLFALAESLGGIESLASLPAKMTHASLSAEAKAESGIDDGLIRLSVGIEDVRDLIKDLEQSLIKASLAEI
ncbi:hypothetical protein O181_059686 [Austropuccinia psidii MF-1]|uniref:cystathionine gamma-lyase n=1 Tax=Austropuccinia psidii MF-1 TaxID=1389203 RepID=A0A9Q3HVX0_9BASI|nr:hypothetical protein [Austropuccinia psidii MF-1]